MQLEEQDALIRQVSTLYNTSFLLRFLEECGSWMCQEGYGKSILWESRWYLLEKQLEELGALSDLVDGLTADKTL